MVCKLCGKEIEEPDEEYCETCKVFLDWKYQKKNERINKKNNRRRRK